MLKVSKPVAAVAVASIFFSVYLLLFTGTKKTAGPASPKAASAARQPVADSRVRIDAGSVSPVSGQDLKWDRDPFSRPAFLNQDDRPAQQNSAAKLEAILEGKQGRVAIIDKEVVARGDMVSGEKVSEIGKDRVVLVNNGSKRILLLGEAQGAGFAKSKPSGEKDKPSGEKK